MDVSTIKRLASCLAAFAALSTATFAGATVRYVSPGGADTNTGLSSGAAWRTIARANSGSVAGDQIMLANGTYADFPNPATSGASGNRITFVGNLADPSAVVISPSGTFSRSYLTVKGVTLNGGFTLSGTRDSITDCIVLGDRSNIAGGNDCMLARLRVNCARFWFYGQETDSLVKAVRDTVQDCVFNLTTSSTAGHIVRLRSIDAFVFDRNVWNITSQQGAVGSSAFKLFWVRNTKFRDSRWNVIDDCTGACDEAGWIMQRDYTQSNYWARDTIDMGGAGAVQFFGSGSGSYPGTVMNNTYDHVLVRLRGNSAYGGAMVYQDGARWDTLTHCTIVGSSSGLLMNSNLTGPTLVDHCTIVGFNPSLGSLGFDAGGSTVWSGPIVFRDNIVYTPGSASRVRNSAALYMPVNVARGKVVANNNVYWSPLSRDSVIYMAGGGLSAPGVGKPYCVDMKADSASIFGSPRFADTSSVGAFDSHIRAGSAAIGAGWGGGDAGTFPLSPANNDGAAPVAVNSLTAMNVSGTSVLLEWVAPVDLPGLGPVTQYDLRWSGSPITDADFTSATPVSPQPSALAPGALQTWTVGGLTSGASYWFAMRAKDAAGNWSVTSNVVTLVASTDQIPPTPINNLRTN